MVGNRQVVRILAGVAPSAAIQRGWLDDALETASDLASTAGEAANDFGDKASDAWASATNTAADVASDIGETAGNAWSAVSDATSDFGEEAGEVASEVGEEASAAWDVAGDAASDVAGAVTGWLADRARDHGPIVVNMFRDLPTRWFRLGQSLVDGLGGIATFTPEAIAALIGGGPAGLGKWFGEEAAGAGNWWATAATRVFDYFAGPEAGEFAMHLLSASTTPITDAEREAAQSVLGAGAIRWDDVRVAEGGLLDVIFALNEERAFVTFHTINVPKGERDPGTMVHELTHVYQYETVGSLYLGQAAHAQATKGAAAYHYGGKAGLAKLRADGGHLRDLNREAQAKLAEDYYLNDMACCHGDPDYEAFIAELRAGEL